MTEIVTQINWLAVALATIAYSATSGIWHRQFAFGKKWEQAMGFERSKDWKETQIYYIVPLISCFVTCCTVALFQELLFVTEFKDALILGLILGIGFATAVTFTNATIPTMKSPLVFGVITGSAHALGITISSLVIFAISA